MGPRAGLDGRKISPHRDSIPRPSSLKSDAIPTELPAAPPIHVCVCVCVCVCIYICVCMYIYIYIYIYIYHNETKWCLEYDSAASNQDVSDNNGK